MAPFDRWADLWNYREKMLHLERGAAFVGRGSPVFNYLAPAAFVYHVLLRAPHPVATFTVLVVGAFALLLIASGVLLVRRRLFRWEEMLALLALAASYPMSFVVYRANLEGIVWAVVTAALCLFLSRRYMAAAIVLAMAMSIKPFPAILLLLFLARRQYRAAMLSVGVAVTLVLCGLAALGPGVIRAYQGLQYGVLLYTHQYIKTFRWPYEQQYAHGILDCIRVLYLRWASTHAHIDPDKVIGTPTPVVFPLIYAVIALVIGVVMVWGLRRKPAVNQVLGASIGLTLLPPSSADYTLCALYLPVLLLGYFLVTEVRSGRAVWGVRHMLLFVVPCAVLLSPLNLLGFWTTPLRLFLLLALAAGAISLPLAIHALDVSAQVAPAQHVSA